MTSTYTGSYITAALDAACERSGEPDWDEEYPDHAFEQAAAAAHHQHRCPACLMEWNCWAPMMEDSFNDGTHDTGECWTCEGETE